MLAPFAPIAIIAAGLCQGWGRGAESLEALKRTPYLQQRAFMHVIEGWGSKSLETETISTDPAAMRVISRVIDLLPTAARTCHFLVYLLSASVKSPFLNRRFPVNRLFLAGPSIVNPLFLQAPSHLNRPILCQAGSTARRLPVFHCYLQWPPLLITCS